jgi:membrane-anchored glycerophosphoryl diester phosphodiesterase (GDPDase)
MTPMQNLWLTIFNFFPAIILGIYKQWWVGLIALAATFFISWLLVFAVTANLSMKAMAAWAWVKPPLVAAMVLLGGWWLF